MKITTFLIYIINLKTEKVKHALIAVMIDCNYVYLIMLFNL